MDRGPKEVEGIASFMPHPETFVAGPYMLHLTVSHFFDDRWVHVGTFAGWMVILSNIANALAASIYFPFVVWPQ